MVKTNGIGRIVHSVHGWYPSPLKMCRDLFVCEHHVVLDETVAREFFGGVGVLDPSLLIPVEIRLDAGYPQRSATVPAITDRLSQRSAQRQSVRQRIRRLPRAPEDRPVSYTHLT